MVPENLLCWKSSWIENADFKFVRIEVVKIKLVIYLMK
jgi:hypothetical protein